MPHVDSLYTGFLSGETTERQFVDEAAKVIDLLVATTIGLRPQCRFLDDDMKSEGLVVLANIMQDRPVLTSFRAYFTTAVRRAINLLLQTDERQIGVSPRTAARYRKEGQEAPAVVVQPLVDPEEWLLDRRDDFTELAILEDIYDCCEDDLDREIVTLRNEGYTHEEVGQHVGLSERGVGRRLKRIEQRYDADD